MNIKVTKLFLLTLFILSFVNADDMIDKEMMPAPSKKSVKSKLPLNYDKDKYLGDDIKYNLKKQRTKEFKLFDVNEEFGYINLANQKVGQSGIIVNKSSSPIIIANAIVVESNSLKTKLEFRVFDELKQDAIPNTNLKVSNGDFFVLNYLYEASIIISPNNESFQVLRKQLSNFDFLHADMLAAFLKVEEAPIPTKELLQRFAMEQNLGTLFIVIENKAYQIDSKTFAIIDTIDIDYEDKKEMKPFYNRVEKIELGTFDFGDEEIENYTNYYKELLDIK